MTETIISATILKNLYSQCYITRSDYCKLMVTIQTEDRQILCFIKKIFVKCAAPGGHSIVSLPHLYVNKHIMSLPGKEPYVFGTLVTFTSARQNEHLLQCKMWRPHY
jgi:hypothetical protein